MLFKYDYDLIDLNKNKLNKLIKTYILNDNIIFNNTILQCKYDVLNNYLINNLLKIYGEQYYY